jgi:uncharacterized protein YfkK (UPF0435 family)
MFMNDIGELLNMTGAEAMKIKSIVLDFFESVMQNEKVCMAKEAAMILATEKDELSHGVFVAEQTEKFNELKADWMETLRIVGTKKKDLVYLRYSISVLKMIYFYTLKSCSEDPIIKRVAIAFSLELNALGREDILFMCLEINYEKLKLTAVKILNAISTDQFEENEQHQLYLVLKDHKNIGSGKNEVIIGTIYLILTKIIQDDKGGNKFATSNFSNFISTSLEMLKKNMSKDTRDDEQDQQEKDALNIGITLFLKSLLKKVGMGGSVETSNNLESISAILKDESYINPPNGLPSEIEKTIGASNSRCKGK